MILFLSTILGKAASDLLLNIMEKYYPLLISRAMRIMDDYYLAEDMVQETLIRLIDYMPKIRELDEQARVAYCVRTLETVCYMYLRKEKKKFIPSKYKSYTQPTPEELLERVEVKSVVHTMLTNLSVRDRKLLIYKYFLDYDNKMIGMLLDMKTKDVSTYLRRAREHALKELQKMRGDTKDG